MKIDKRLKELTNGDYWYYVIEDGGRGIVKADSPEDAEIKVRNAYKKHGGLSEYTTVEIYGDICYFDDSPDVIEIGD